jgi:hypothetical protein
MLVLMTLRDSSVRRLGRLFGETFAATLLKIGWQHRTVAAYARAQEDWRHDSVARDAGACPVCGRSELSAARTHIDNLQQRIAALEEENALLTSSANTFADLAERLNTRLRGDNWNSV